jgi:hypothetical protein
LGVELAECVSPEAGIHPTTRQRLHAFAKCSSLEIAASMGTNIFTATATIARHAMVTFCIMPNNALQIKHAIAA